MLFSFHLSQRHSVPRQDMTSVTPCTLQTLWIIDVLWGRTSARGAPHITDLSGKLNFWCRRALSERWTEKQAHTKHWTWGSLFSLNSDLTAEWFLYGWSVSASLEMRDWGVVFCVLTSDKHKILLEVFLQLSHCLPPGQGLCCLRAAVFKLLPFPVGDLFFAQLPPFLKFTGTYGLIDEYLSAGLVGVAQMCSAVTRMGSEGHALSGVGTRCDSTSCASLGKQTAKSGAARNKIQLSIAAILQQNDESKDEAIIQRLPQIKSYWCWLFFVPGSPSWAP